MCLSKTIAMLIHTCHALRGSFDIPASGIDCDLPDMKAEERKRARESERKGWQLRAYKYTEKDDSELAPKKGKPYYSR